MLVAILHNAVSAHDSPEDQDTLVQVETVEHALRQLGHEPVPVPCTLDLAAMRRRLEEMGTGSEPCSPGAACSRSGEVPVPISRESMGTGSEPCSPAAACSRSGEVPVPIASPMVVFNLVESLAGDDSLAYLAPAVLDAMRLSYTGNPTTATFLTIHKLLAKQWLASAGLPTPAWLSRGAGCQPVACGAGCQPACDWIIKGVFEQGSRNLDEEAIVREVNADTVRRRIEARVAQLGRPCYAERFIAGREIVVAMLDGPAGPQALPPAEIDFSAFPPGKPRIVGYRAKWQADSFEFQNTPRRFDFPPEDSPLLDRLRQLCLECWTLFGLRGYVRVDFRVDTTGQPWILEVNTNPCLSPDAGFYAALQQAGIGFAQAIGRILAATN